LLSEGLVRVKQGDRDIRNQSTHQGARGQGKADLPNNALRSKFTKISTIAKQISWEGSQALIYTNLLTIRTYILPPKSSQLKVSPQGGGEHERGFSNVEAKVDYGWA